MEDGLETIYAMKFGIHYPLQLDPTDFSGPLVFSLAPPSVRQSGLRAELNIIGCVVIKCNTNINGA